MKSLAAVELRELMDIRHSSKPIEDEWERLPPSPDCAECIYGDRGAPRGNLQELAAEVRSLKARIFGIYDSEKTQGRLEALISKLERKFEDFKPVDPSGFRIALADDCIMPCGHPGCKRHASHPCEGCGRQWIGSSAYVIKIQKQEPMDIRAEKP